MSRQQVIDIHTHVFTEAMIDSMKKEAPSINLKVTPINRDGAVLEIANLVQKPFPRKAWDLEQRFRVNVTSLRSNPANADTGAPVCLRQELQ